MRTLASLCVLSFLVNLGYGIVLPVLPTLANATPVDVGFMYSIFSAAKLVAQLVGGAAADRMGAERVLRLGVVAYAVSLAGLGWADEVSSVLVFRAVEGLAVGVVVPAVSAIVLSTGDAPDFTRRHGIVLGVGGAGMVVGPLVGFAVGRDSVRPAMLVTAGVTLLAAWLAPKIAAHARAASVAPVSLVHELLGYARSGTFVVLVLPLAFGKLAFGLLQPLLPLHAEHIALTDLEVAGLFGATGVLFALMQPVAGAVRARFSARGMTVAFAALAALTFAVMALWLGKAGFVACYLAYVVFGSLLFAANSGLVGETYHEAQDDHGKVFGAMHAVTDLGMLVGHPLLLALYERDVTLSFLALTGLGVSATSIFALAGRRRPAG